MTHAARESAKDMLARNYSLSIAAQDSTIEKIYRIITPYDDHVMQPVWILVVCETTECGVVPVCYGATSLWQFPVTVVSLSPREAAELQPGGLGAGHSLGRVLFQREVI